MWFSRRCPVRAAVLCAAAVVLWCGGASGGAPVLVHEGKTLAQVEFDDGGQMRRCELHELEEEADAAPLIAASGLSVRRPDFAAMLRLVGECTRLERPDPANATAPDGTEAPDQWSPWALWSGIAPGTKWCGIGDVAESFSDLGVEAGADACCRAHDHCPVKLKAFRAGYGLLNLSLYTRSHCDCDREFYSCLKRTGKPFANVVGNFYFNFMRVQCLKNNRPLVCTQNRTEQVSGNQSCVQWGPDPDAQRMQVTLTQLKY